MKRNKDQGLLDEMQRTKQFQIEEIGANLCFWGLLAAIVIQLLLKGTLTQVLGEIIVFAALSVFNLAASIRQGIWTNRFAATRKNCVWGSVLAAAAVGAVFLVKALLSRQPFTLQLAAVIGGSMAAAFAVCLLLLESFRRVYQKRREQLDEGDGQD